MAPLVFAFFYEWLKILYLHGSLEPMKNMLCHKLTKQDPWQLLIMTCQTKNSIGLSPCVLTHWGRVMHICVSKLTIIGSDNGLSPGRHQAIIRTNAGILLIGSLGTNFSEILIKICTFSLKKIHLKLSSGKWRPFCLGLNVLKLVSQTALFSSPVLIMHSWFQLFMG